VAAKKLLGESVGAMISLYGALEEAGLLLIIRAVDTSGDLIEHKYGREVGVSAKEALGVVSDLSEARISMKRVGIGAIAKRYINDLTCSSI